LIGMMSIALFATSCKKDNDESETVPQPENPKTYLGTTDQDLAASFGTAEIGGALYLMSFSIDLMYHDTVHGSTHQETISQSISTGIVPFNGDSFQYSGTDLTLNGSLDNGDMNLNGTYNWKYDDVNTYSGIYFTVKQ